VPAGRPVKLIMTSDDVLHAFFIPDFRTKMDVIPNRYTSMWFLPEEKENAVYKVFCAEYCGDKHSEMGAQIRVLSAKAYEDTIFKWANGPDGKWTLRDYGENLYKGKCSSCHSIDGSPNTGPTWKNHFGYSHDYVDHAPAVADDQWLNDHILNSQLAVVKGYGKPSQMPVFQGQLNALQVQSLIVYMRTLSDKKDQAQIDADEAAYIKQKEAAAKAKADGVAK